MNQPEALYRPYRIGRQPAGVPCGFRDHTLSDLIGFSYASWSADGAAEDFLQRLLAAGRRFSSRTGGEVATVFVILDGENAWEYYDSQGRRFLRALYARLESHPEIETVTMSEACSRATETLPSIFPGSWINGDFYIWIGHADDHRAWSQLVDARRTLESAAGTDSAALGHAREEMLIAEGSDWFWWYGDDHSSEHDLAFDDLFRRHVRNVYRALDKPIPEELFVTNISTAPPALRIDPPSGLITPAIDGEASSYFEWVGAGSVHGSNGAGTMHRVAEVAPIVTAVQFGVDLHHLFVRIDGSAPMRGQLESGLEVRLKYLKPAGLQLVLQLLEGALACALEERREDGSWSPRSCRQLQAAAGRILELRVPFDCLRVVPREALAFIVVVSRAGKEVEHYPRLGPIEVGVPDRDFQARNWTV